MSAVLMDTNALVWFLNGELLHPGALTAIAEAQAIAALLISPLSAWEAALAAKKRSKQPDLAGLSPEDWFRAALALPGAKLAPVTRTIGLEAARVPAIYGSGDPGDCFLIATARRRKASIVTRDAMMIQLAASNPAYLKVVPC